MADGSTLTSSTEVSRVLRAIRASGGITRADLIEATGLSRSSLAPRIDALLAAGLVRQDEAGRSTGGRPPASLVFDGSAGVVLAADLGVTHGRLAVCDLCGAVLAEKPLELQVANGPEKVLTATLDGFASLLTGARIDDGLVRGVGLGLPGPVEHATGRPVSPPLMPGWDAYPVAERVRERLAVPVLVDNDVNIMGLGEHDARRLGTASLLFVKIGSGIGCGIIIDGRLFRGAQGAAGDIGHIRVNGFDDVICHCGNGGCLEAVAGSSALVEALRAQGRRARDGRDVARLVAARDREAVRLVRRAGRLLGEVLAGLVNGLNPDTIVLGGDLARAYDELAPGVRELVYQRSTPLATRELEVSRSALDERAGVVGAAKLVVDRVLSPDGLMAVLSPSS